MEINEEILLKAPFSLYFRYFHKNNIFEKVFKKCVKKNLFGDEISEEFKAKIKEKKKKDFNLLTEALVSKNINYLFDAVTNKNHSYFPRLCINQMTGLNFKNKSEKTIAGELNQYLN